jgi:hypothetical protein
VSEWKSSSESLTLARFPCAIPHPASPNPTIQPGTDRADLSGEGSARRRKYILGRKL